MKKIKSALISVYHKDGLEQILEALNEQGVQIYSTGGTQRFIEKQGFSVTAVESLTEYPSILGGRVKTLHPKVFGGILARRQNEGDLNQLEEYAIPEIDLVIVDLYPFEDTVAQGASEEDIIEKIDIGGIALIRATAKNYRDTLIVSNRSQYSSLVGLLEENGGATTLDDRKRFAAEAFEISSHYDSAIFNYFNDEIELPSIKVSYKDGTTLRYGENPHQKGIYYGNLEEVFDKLNGKAISYNNLVDIDAAVHLINEFENTTFAVLKHTNACGVASRPKLLDAWKDALAGDPVSAFGGVLITNATIDLATAEEINKLFFEVLVAPDFDLEALDLLKSKKNRILLKQKTRSFPIKTYKTLLNGVIEQDADRSTQKKQDLKEITKKKPEKGQIDDLLFANKIVKHLKSNTIVLAKNNQLLGMGCGQTSRVDALKQAILKAKHFGLNLEGGVMASDAFFPFPDCVEIAHQAGIKTVIQPGGSIKDQLSIDYCNSNDLAMVFTGVRHFKH